MEQEEYTKEEIDWSYIEFVDNQDILDLIEKVCASNMYSVLLSFLSLIVTFFVCWCFSCILCTRVAPHFNAMFGSLEGEESRG
jgi:hypothetical protein